MRMLVGEASSIKREAAAFAESLYKHPYSYPGSSKGNAARYKKTVFATDQKITQKASAEYTNLS